MTERMTLKDLLAHHEKAAGKRRRRVDRESPVQIEIVAWIRASVPNLIVHHCRNEINRSGGLIAKELGLAAQKGAVKGFPDLLLLPFAAKRPAMFFEVKAEGNYADKTQKALHEQLRAMGYPVGVVRSVQDVRECLAEWGVWFVGSPHRLGAET